ncbi:MAG: type II secretion system major pseudopilin GspG [Deltaproteobacteria bacterium]|nr:type II secretion system major pseudopilin GspG [Deltaproteobacteria bacterium]
MKRVNIRNKEKGFTLIEIMVVVIIIGLLVSIVGVNVISRVDTAKRVAAKNQMKSLESALSLYRLDTGTYPKTEQGMKALLEKPATGDVSSAYREGGYLDANAIPKDPWGHEYVYLSPGSEGREYEVISYGADGEPGGEGKDADIQSWTMEVEE